MPQADSSSAAAESGEDIVLHATGTSDGWREGVLVLLIVLAPVGLAAIAMAIGLSGRTAWQIARGVPLELPAPATIQQYGMLSYAVGSWIAVALAWLWSSRRRLGADVFVFRRLRWPALAGSIVGFVIAMYGIPIVTRWLSLVTGGPSHGVRIDFHDAKSITIFVFLFVVTAPVFEEILYRGLLVTWLRRAGCGDSAVLLVGSLIFGANHLIPLGFVWSAAMVGFGAVLFGLRLRYDSLLPGWLTHVLFNSQPFLTYPLIAWMALAALPGGL